jgi:ABC-type dipeptide/oligopeptide/nickel transport system permease component
LRVYIIRRLLLLVPIVFGVITITFIMIHSIPGDPLDLIYGTTKRLTLEEKERISESLGLNDPLMVQYGRYIVNLFKGDMGISITTRAPVTYEIFERFPDTLLLTGSSMLLVILIAVPLGIISALKRGSWIDTMAMSGAMLGVSMPAFWFGIMLMLLFGLYLDWLPTGGQGKTPVELVKSLVMPSVTLSLILVGLLTRMVRSSMLEVLNQDYVRTARSKGLRNLNVVFKHALPNAFIPILTVISGQVAILLGGVVIIESVFSWPGIGRLAVNSVFRRDYQIVTGTVLIFTFIVITINLLTDILYSFIDPRIRLQ